MSVATAANGSFPPEVMCDAVAKLAQTGRWRSCGELGLCPASLRFNDDPAYGDIQSKSGTANENGRVFLSLHGSARLS